MRRSWWTAVPPKIGLLRAVGVFPELPARSAAGRYWPLVEAAVTLLARVPARIVLETSEPRRYDVASAEWRAARLALESGRLTGVTMGIPPEISLQRPVDFDLSFGRPGDRNVPVTVELRWGDPSVACDAAAWVALFKDWAAREGAAQLLVSRRDDFADRTALEQGEALPAFRAWSAYQQYLRGVGWGTFLGATLCDRLAGAQRVAATAPCWGVELVGDGVWLQMSPALDQEPGDAAWAAITEYLRPLFAPYEVWKHRIELAPLKSSRRVPRPGRRGRRLKIGFPVRVVADDGSDLVLNVYFRTRPSTAAATGLEALVADWYAEGQERGFPPDRFEGERRFGLITPVVLTGQVARWRVDAGGADPSLALRDLTQRLELFGRESGCLVDQVAVGKEGL